MALRGRRGRPTGASERTPKTYQLGGLLLALRGATRPAAAAGASHPQLALRHVARWRGSGERHLARVCEQADVLVTRLAYKHSRFEFFRCVGAESPTLAQRAAGVLLDS